MSNPIETYCRNGQWRVRVNGASLVGGFKTESIAKLHGEWYHSTQCVDIWDTSGNERGFDPDEDYIEGRM